jgi:hypothetical protein
VALGPETLCEIPADFASANDHDMHFVSLPDRERQRVTFARIVRFRSTLSQLLS